MPSRTMAHVQMGFMKPLAPWALPSLGTHLRRLPHTHHPRPRWVAQAEDPLAAAPAAAATPPPPPPTISLLDSIDPIKLKALRRLGLEMRDVIKLGRLGAGAGAVVQIRNRWRTSEASSFLFSVNFCINISLHTLFTP